METKPENLFEEENALLEKIYARFPELAGAGTITCKRRIFLPVARERLLEVLAFLSEKLTFSELCAITGMDSVDCYEFLYHIGSDETGIVLNIKTSAPKDGPVIPSVLPVYNGATFYERELESTLGVTVEGLPPGRQYPLPDNWPAGQYPLRKDWKPEMLRQNAAAPSKE